MEIILADNAGFCFGVNRAINISDKTLKNKLKGETIYSFGPLIHNPQEVERLEELGLTTLNIDLGEVDLPENSKVIIRSHGVSREIIEKLEERNNKIVDTTCPYVKAIHNKVGEYRKKGYTIVIVGDSNHPEVIGINGWCENSALIINSRKEAEQLPDLDKVYLVSQTTNRKDLFDEVSQIIKEKADLIKIDNTICNATRKRQNSVKDLNNRVDGVIVIGGFHSSNTNKLVEVSKKISNNVFHIETFKDIPLDRVSKLNTIGVTAGASTPDWIIKEAIKAMENLNNNENEMDMMEAIDKSFTQISRGDIIEGEVIFVTDKEVMVNINYSSDGIINKNELSNELDVNPKDIFKEGDKVQVYVMRTDDGEGNVVLSYKRVKDMKSWEIIEEKHENNELLDVKVDRVVKGGLIVLVEGINGFIPASHASARYVTDLKQFVGKEFKVSILDFDKQKRRLVLSRKEVEQKELEEVREKLWDSLEVDSTIEGEVQRLTNFGAFVDLGGVDGLIHISDLSWNRINHPSEVVEPGDKVEVKVLDFDKEKNRISLGLKQLKEKPWDLFKESAEVNDIVEGRVVNLLDFGAFVRLEEGVDGLLHVSEISTDHVNKPSDVLSLGDKIKVKIIDINYEEEKISLSKKEVDSPSEDKADEDEEEIEVEENKEIE